MSNQDAMRLLKNTLADCAKDGSININVNRFIVTAGTLDDVNTSHNSSSRSTPHVVKKFDDRTELERSIDVSNVNSMNRTKSYNIAVNSTTATSTPKSLNSSSPSPFFQPKIG